MNEVYTLTLPFPPTANNLFVNNRFTGGRFPSAGYTAWQQRANDTLDQQQPLPQFTGAVEVEYLFGRPDKRRRDVANGEKAVSDILVKRGVIADDSLIDRMILAWSDGHPGIVIVMIKPLETQ